MLRADLADAFEIALRRNEHTHQGRDRLDEHRCDRRRIMELHELLELVRQLRAVFRLAAREGVALQVVRVRDVIHHGIKVGRPELAIRADAAEGRAAQVHAVIRALAADDLGALGVTLKPVIGESDLHRGIDRFGARVREEHVIQPGGRDLLHRIRKLVGDRMAHLERFREVHRFQLLRDGFGNLLAAVTRVHAPRARHPRGDSADRPAVR